jgi:hypothetical protein
MGNMIKRTLFTGVAVGLGFAMQTASASAAVRPMTTDNCGTLGTYDIYECMYIEGTGNYASEIRGWGYDKGAGYTFHIQVTGPDGTVCNSPTTSVVGQVVGCQVYPGTIDYGTYCAILWYYDGGYTNVGEQCDDVVPAL